MKIGPVSLLGVGTGYRATLMSGGSHRLWNQLLHATLFRSASLFRWRTRRLAFQSRVEFIPPLPFLQNPTGHQKSLSLSLSLFLSLLSVLVMSVRKKRLIPYRKKLLESKRSHGGSIPRKVRPVQVKIHPHVQECRYYRYIIYANYHRRSKSIAETGDVSTCLFPSITAPSLTTNRMISIKNIDTHATRG